MTTNSSRRRSSLHIPRTDAAPLQVQTAGIISSEEVIPASDDRDTQMTGSLPAVGRKKKQHLNSEGQLTEEQTFYLTPLLRRKVRKLAAITNVDMSDIAQLALEQFISSSALHEAIMQIIQIEDTYGSSTK